MNAGTVYSTIISWLKNSEMFARPSKQLIGKWQLFEYYTEPENVLIHKHEKQLKEEQFFLTIEFSEDGNFSSDTNLPVTLIDDQGKFTWATIRNYITLIHSDDFRKNQEFQFAIEKGVLKILKKDSFGKIVLFGFLKKSASEKVR